MLRVVTAPNPILRQKAIDLPGVTKKVVMRAREMLKLMHREGGIGLAANQVSWPVKLFVIQLDPSLESKTFINTAITLLPERELGVEGCLSVDGVQQQVWRSKGVLVSGLLITGNELKRASPKVVKLENEEFRGFEARVIQHEFDHSNGILFPDYTDNVPVIAESAV